MFRVEIERAHMEEDAGKLTHMGGAAGRIQGADFSLVDYNRSGVPLVEIVTKPIEGAGSRAPELAKAYVAAVREIVKNLGVSDARMERGNVRCDANVSLRPHGRERFGIRSETKNVNSLRAVEHAVRYEIQRHAAVLDTGNPVVQETRHWHEDTRTTTSGRPKSDADDYRYFPEPDLVPVVASREWVEELRATLPEPPAARRKRLQADWGYSDLEFRDVVNAGVLDEIEETIAAGASASVARKWWMGEIVGRAKNADVDPGQLGVQPATIVELAQMVEDGKINNKMATAGPGRRPRRRRHPGGDRREARPGRGVRRRTPPRSHRRCPGRAARRRGQDPRRQGPGHRRDRWRRHEGHPRPGRRRPRPRADPGEAGRHGYSARPPNWVAVNVVLSPQNDIYCDPVGL